MSEGKLREWRESSRYLAVNDQDSAVILTINSLSASQGGKKPLLLTVGFKENCKKSKLLGISNCNFMIVMVVSRYTQV